MTLRKRKEDMVELPVSILNTGIYEPVMYVLHAIVLSSCLVQRTKKIR